MLTDTALRKLKPNSATYKVADRDGVYVTVSKTGTITFRYDYRLNGRRETLTLGGSWQLDSITDAGEHVGAGIEGIGMSAVIMVIVSLRSPHDQGVGSMKANLLPINGLEA
jgi:hypothetical protein